MCENRKDIIARLRKDILPLEGFKPPASGNESSMGLGEIEMAFPNGCFPLGAVHEFISESAEHAASTSGFVTGLLAALMRKGGACVWISKTRTVFPPALKTFGIEPDRIIFADLIREKDMLWAMEEALKCNGLASVIGEIRTLSFTASRRLQLAVEQSRVTGFMLRHNPPDLTTNASIARWKITSLPSSLGAGMPGIGFPRWNIELQKIRNGKPGIWQVEWVSGKFQPVVPMEAAIQEQIRQTG